MSTKNFSQAIGPDFEPVVFIHFIFDSGSSRLHSGVGKLSWGGNDWLGVGDLGTIRLKEGIDLKPTKTVLTLSSVNATFMSQALTADSEGRTAEIYLGTIGTDGLVNGTPDLLLAGLMSSPSVDLEAGTVSLEVEDFRSRLFLSNGKRFTLEDHQEDHAGDLFFEFLPKMVDWRFTFNGRNNGGNNVLAPRNDDAYNEPDDWFIEG